MQYGQYRCDYAEFSGKIHPTPICFRLSQGPKPDTLLFEEIGCWYGSLYDNFSDTTSSPTSITLSVGYDLAVLGILSVLFCFILSYPVSQIPYYGDTGLNSGVMLIDLDRVRKLDNGWTGKAESIEFVYRTHNQFVPIDANFFLFRSLIRDNWQI